MKPLNNFEQIIRMQTKLTSLPEAKPVLSPFDYAQGKLRRKVEGFDLRLRYRKTHSGIRRKTHRQRLSYHAQISQKWLNRYHQETA